MSRFQYQVGILGAPWLDREELRLLMERAAANLGIGPDSLAIFEGKRVKNRSRKAPFVAVYAGDSSVSHTDASLLEPIHGDSLPIIPVVTTLDGFRGKVPLLIAGVNGLQVSSSADKQRLVSTIFENLGLLRSERRLFISYRRAESTRVAMQLYEALDERGFDVFLDTRSIKPAVDVQDEIWHRLSDSDIVVLLDTPGFRVSYWTIAELTQANSTNIQILHLLWPGVDPDDSSSFSSFMPLKNDDFMFGQGLAPNSTLSDHVVKAICENAERLRSRALAARYTYLVDTFCDIVSAHGCRVDVNPERYLSFEWEGDQLAVFPAVGVPNAHRMEQFERQIEKSTDNSLVRVIYDERGVLESWKSHLTWLSEHLPVRTLQLTQVESALERGRI